MARTVPSESRLSHFKQIKLKIALVEQANTELCPHCVLIFHPDSGSLEAKGSGMSAGRVDERLAQTPCPVLARPRLGRCHGVMVPIKHKRGRGEEVQRVFTGNLVPLYWPA